MTTRLPHERRADRALGHVPRYEVRFDHFGLLSRLPDRAGDGTGCDAVIVPTHGASWGLDFALALAGDLSCTLLVLCSQGREAVVADALGRSTGAPERWLLALPHGGPPPEHGVRPVPQFATWDEPGARATKYRDLALKRSTGLALGRMLGWRTVLFLDDDIRGLGVVDVADAVRTLSYRGPTVVSWRTSDFPDNSAVCHAGRLAGTDQGVFVGSGALAVRLDAYAPLFPPVYNEDWCFLFDALERREVAWAGDVRQLPYDPFDPVVNRGGNEEFGDLLGEGLFHLLHHGLGLGPAVRESYWSGVVAARREFILRTKDGLLEQLRVGVISPQERRRLGAAMVCIDQALRKHGLNLPRQLVSFVRAWRADQEVWKGWFDQLPDVGADMTAAARLLGWPPEHLLSAVAR
jgi:hypothetical protein